jgi:hypothetical protein
MTGNEYYEKRFKFDLALFWKQVPHGEAFRFRSLIRESDFDALQGISEKDQVYFLASLGCLILMDECLYTYFSKDYPAFQELTRYPKITVGWVNVSPWMVFHQNVRLSRGISKPEAMMALQEVAEPFLNEEKIFFERSRFVEATWPNIREALLRDPGTSEDGYEASFVETLKKMT